MVDEIKEKDKEFDMIENANAVAERLERANKETRDMLEKMEKMESRRILGGLAMASEEKKAPETPAEYAKRMLRGGQ